MHNVRIEDTNAGMNVGGMYVYHCYECRCATAMLQVINVHVVYWMQRDALLFL